MEKRCRFPVEIVSQIRKALGERFLIIYRISLLDLVENGNSWEDTLTLAKRMQEAGASMLSTGIGWHEARIPTIASSVPPGALTWTSAQLKKVFRCLL